MSISKFLLPIVSSFLSARTHSSKINSQSSMIKVVSETIRKEISKLILKIVFGLVATGVLIYSLIVLGQHLQFYLLLYDNGTVLSIFFFSIVSVLCVFLLFKLFHKAEAEEDPISKLFSGNDAKFRLGKIYEQFMAGMAEGIRENPVDAEPKSKARIDDFDDVEYSDKTH